MAKKDYNQDYDEEKTSRINSAGIINVTLENLWREVYQSMSKGDLKILNRKLDCIWAILGGDEKEGGDIDKKMNKIDLEIYETGSLNPKKNGFEKITEIEKNKQNLQYILLKKKALFLRRLQNSQGKGTAYVNEDFDDFD